MHPNPVVKLFWISLSSLFILAGLALISIFSLPFESAKSLADLLSKDGNLQSFTPAFFAQANIPVRLISLALLAAGIWSLWKKEAAHRALGRIFAWLGSCFRQLRIDCISLWSSMRSARVGKVYLIALLGLILVAIVVRAEHMNGPVYHDEAYTFVDYASHPVWTIITDYTLPNNHILHSLLVHFSYMILGDAPWVIRLPAFFAGILMIPAAFLVGRLLYDDKIALLATALLVAIPDMIGYSASARGYTLVTLFSLLTFALGIYLTRNKNSFAWLLLVILTALGFYTIPTMLYPTGILFTWLVLTAFTRETKQVYGSSSSFIRYAVAAGVTAAILTLVLYTPVFIYSGVDSVFNNTFVRSNSLGSFLTDALPSTIWGVWTAWNAGLPNLGNLFLAAFASSLVFHWHASRTRVPVQLAAVLFVVVALLVQRPNSAARVWIFLLPFFLIWVSAGILSPFMALHAYLWKKMNLTKWVMTAGMVGILVIAVMNGVAYLPDMEHPFIPTEETALYLKGIVQPGDIIVVTNPYDMSLIYYLVYHGVSKEYTKDIARQSFQRAYVVVYPESGQTVLSVIEATGLDPRVLQPASARLLANISNAFVYECLPVALNPG